MAKKSKMSRGMKTQAVNEFLAANPEAGPTAIVAALKKQGITITMSHASNIKSKLNKAQVGRKTAKKRATAAVEAPVVVEKPANGTITLEQVKKVALTIKSLGGLNYVTEVLEVIKEMGGVKKFRDLAEAISVTAADDIPF
jgi:transcriptional regulator with GAF, ATPase, and Fis domain